MATMTPRSERFRTQKAEIEGYVKLRQGIHELGISIFGLAYKDDMETLDKVKQDILKTGTVNEICDDEPLYESIGHLLLLSGDVDELADRAERAYSVLAHQYNCKAELDSAPAPLQPESPLSDYSGLARYAGQLLQQYQNTLQAAGHNLDDLRSDNPLLADIHERLDSVHRTLTALT